MALSAALSAAGSSSPSTQCWSFTAAAAAADRQRPCVIDISRSNILARADYELLVTGETFICKKEIQTATDAIPIKSAAQLYMEYSVLEL